MEKLGELTAEEFARRAFDLRLLDERQLHEVWGHLASRSASLDRFEQEVLRREYMTSFQVTRLLKGLRSGFFYGNYKILYKVGSGSFARVFRAVHRDTGEIVAVKVLRSRYCDDPRQTEQFYREGEMVSNLRHENIVPIHLVYSKSPFHYLVMDFIEGRNLHDFLKVRKALEPDEATRLIIEVTRGLSYAAEQGISHRDLKLTNILVSIKGQAKLVDFGLAMVDSTMSDEAISKHPNPRTIDYVGLERSSGVRKGDPRSDIFFLGCIYYHLLTGSPALYETKDRIQRLSRSRFEDIIPVENLDPLIPEPVTRILHKAMELNTARRYQTMAQMLTDLEKVADLIGQEEEMDNIPDILDPDEEGEVPDRKPVIQLIPESEPKTEPPKKVIMFIEADEKMQNFFRERFKKAGYRVLMTSDPQRALLRFEDKSDLAHCVIFSTARIGVSALKAFNTFGENPKTAEIPAVLLLDEKNPTWKEEAEAANHRVIVPLPVKLKTLREVVSKLVPVNH